MVLTCSTWLFACSHRNRKKYFLAAISDHRDLPFLWNAPWSYHLFIPRRQNLLHPFTSLIFIFMHRWTVSLILKLRAMKVSWRWLNRVDWLFMFKRLLQAIFDLYGNVYCIVQYTSFACIVNRLVVPRWKTYFMPEIEELQVSRSFQPIEMRHDFHSNLSKLWVLNFDLWVCFCTEYLVVLVLSVYEIWFLILYMVLLSNDSWQQHSQPTSNHLSRIQYRSSSFAGWSQVYQ